MWSLLQISYPDVPGAVQMCSALRKALKLPTDLLFLDFTAIRKCFVPPRMLCFTGWHRHTVVKGKCPSVSAQSGFAPKWLFYLFIYFFSRAIDSEHWPAKMLPPNTSVSKEPCNEAPFLMLALPQVMGTAQLNWLFKSYLSRWDTVTKSKLTPRGSLKSWMHAVRDTMG